MIIEIIVFFVSTLIIYVLYSHYALVSHYKKHDIRVLSGIPFFGNFFQSSFLKRHFVDDLQEIYDAFPEERYVGVMETTSPILMIKDPELIKQLTIKDFDHFTDHRQFFDESMEPLFGGSLLMLKGEKWRDMRSTLSPAFTGSKMRQMIPFMTEISNNIMEHLRSEVRNGPDGKVSDVLDIDDLMRRYTNDVIASAAFGLQVNSLKDKENEFYTAGQTFSNFTTWQRVTLFILFTMPAIGKKLGITMISKKTNNFFRSLIRNTMDYREKNNVERPDMIQLLMEASKGTLKSSNTEKDNIGFATVDEITTKDEKPMRKWTPDELTGQAFIFFFAGFESSASVLVMAIHEMAVNRHVQDKMYEEIERLKIRERTLDYEMVQELKYLDMIINETFRKWSPALVMDRECTKPYVLPPAHPGGKEYEVKRGDVIYNVVTSIHMDEKYYPNPEQFDPERFSDENKHKIKATTFMPFGSGPRNCIGSRFALLELKILLLHLILNFEILKCEKTSDPIKLQPHEFNVRAVGGTLVKLRERL